MSKSQNIFLIGMPGAGKSTVGKSLAKILDMPFIDTDDEIVRRNGVEIATIFEIEGEAGFRQREVVLIDELTRQSGLVMATGGGAILHPHNRAVLSARGLVVYLRADVDTLVKRITQMGGKRNKRPLLNNANVHERLTGLLTTRGPLYNEIADLTISLNHSNRLQIARELASKIAHHSAQLTAHSSPTPPSKK